MGLLGTAAREVDAAGRHVGSVTPPAGDAAIRRALIRKNPVVHSSVMMRRQLVERAGGYDPAFDVAQDYDLWMKLSRLARMANLAEPLVVRRLVPGRVGAARDSERLRAEVRVRWRALRRGDYPWWRAVYLARPLAALAIPETARRPLRRSFRAARPAS